VSMSSLQAVKKFTRNQESFTGNSDISVYKNGELQWHYRNIYIRCYFVVSYGQYTIEIMWENDKKQYQTYHERGLHGQYNTNFQEMKYKDGVLIIIADEYEICILG